METTKKINHNNGLGMSLRNVECSDIYNGDGCINNNNLPLFELLMTKSLVPLRVILIGLPM